MRSRQRLGAGPAIARQVVLGRAPYYRTTEEKVSNRLNPGTWSER